jgi:hypothetical protein
MADNAVIADSAGNGQLAKVPLTPRRKDAKIFEICPKW